MNWKINPKFQELYFQFSTKFFQRGGKWTVKQEIYNMILKIQNTTKINEKKVYLKNLYKLSLNITNIFTQILNPFINFYIKKIDEMNEFDTNEYNLEEFITDMKIFINVSSRRLITGNRLRDEFKQLYRKYGNDDFYKYILDSILKKDLRLGVNVKLHNQVIKEIIKETKDKIYEKYIIPESFCMLAEDSKFGTKHIQNDIYYIVEPKLDGVRCITIVDKDGFKMISRNGKRYNKFEEYFEKYFKVIVELVDKGIFEPFVLDGEMLTQEDEFNKVVGLGHSKHINDFELKYMVFDYITLDDYNDIGEKLPLYKRKENLLKFFLKLNQLIMTNELSPEKFNYNEFINYVDMVENLLETPIKIDNDRIYNIFNHSMEYYKTKYGKYSEGIMLKDIYSIYQKKRSKSWIKMKKMKTIDLRVIDMENGTGKYKNVLGNLICEDKEGNLVKVGSGFSDNQREEYWNKRNELIGNIVEIQYQEITKNKNGTKSLRFPVFVRFRDDKDQPDEII